MRRLKTTVVQNPGGGGGELLYAKVDKFLTSRIQIKDSGLTYGIDDETSLFLAVKVSFRVH